MTVSPSPEPDEDGLMMVMLNELHSNMPEIDRPMSLSDLSDEQTERARKAVRAVTQAAATICESAHNDRGVRNAAENLAAWARIIERPAIDGDNRLEVSPDAAEGLARDIRIVIAALPPPPSEEQP